MKLPVDYYGLSTQNGLDFSIFPELTASEKKRMEDNLISARSEFMKLLPIMNPSFPSEYNYNVNSSHVEEVDFSMILPELTASERKRIEDSYKAVSLEFKKRLPLMNKSDRRNHSVTSSDYEGIDISHNFRPMYGHELDWETTNSKDGRNELVQFLSSRINHTNFGFKGEPVYLLPEIYTCQKCDPEKSSHSTDLLYHFLVALIYLFSIQSHKQGKFSYRNLLTRFQLRQFFIDLYYEWKEVVKRKKKFLKKLPPPFFVTNLRRQIFWLIKASPSHSEDGKDADNYSAFHKNNYLIILNQLSWTKINLKFFAY